MPRKAIPRSPGEGCLIPSQNQAPTSPSDESVFLYLLRYPRAGRKKGEACRLVNQNKFLARVAFADGQQLVIARTAILRNPKFQNSILTGPVEPASHKRPAATRATSPVKTSPASPNGPSTSTLKNTREKRERERNTPRCE